MMAVVCPPVCLSRAWP